MQVLINFACVFLHLLFMPLLTTFCYEFEYKSIIVNTM